MDKAEAFRRIQAHCLAKPGAVEEYPWDHHAWKVKGKCFCIGTEGNAGVTVKATLDEQAALTQLPHIEVASYVGRFGWISVSPTDSDMLDHALQLIDRSFELVTAKARSKR